MENGKTCKTTGNRKRGWKITRALWLVAGMICLILGAIGMVLPILPTTPFLLAAAACFCNSSPRMYNWLLNNKWFGEYIKNYKEGRGLPVRTKITALTVLWMTIGLSTVFLLHLLLPSQLVLPMQLVMVAVAIFVSVYILRLPTFKKGVGRTEIEN
ncbi:MAG TPA: YbaN family protein [Candidatus Bathyarchaeia archaeon]